MTMENKVPKKKLWIAGGLLFLFALLINLSIYYKVSKYGP